MKTLWINISGLNSSYLLALQDNSQGGQPHLGIRTYHYVTFNVVAYIPSNLLWLILLVSSNIIGSIFGPLFQNVHFLTHAPIGGCTLR